MVINDVGPTLGTAALARIASYVGKPVRFVSIEEAVDYTARVNAPFALKTHEEWREITVPTIRPDGDSWILHYDPRIAEPAASVTPLAAAAGEAALWQLYENIEARVLLTRGANSDLLSPATAKRMTGIGPRARVVEFPGVGHAPMFMQDDQIAVVRAFLTGE
jgi:pimeloyl-ACP methyl ester carboxylesterase